MPGKRLGSVKDRISWSVILVSLISLFLPDNLKLTVTSSLGTVFLFPLRTISSLRTTIATLGSENRRLSQLCAELALENARLKSQLPLRTSPPAAKIIRAPIIARDLGTLKRFLTVSRGTIDGIQIGAIALAPEGIVGRVIAVSTHQALVQTIFEPGFRVAAMNNRTRDVALMSPTSENLLSLDYVAPDADFQPGDTVITSGLGGIFPKGLAIGVVKTVNKNEDALFQSVLVEPFAPITRLEQVFILSFDSFPDPWLDNLKPQEIKIPE
ncbi:MAG: rod shape-determining protein MreC [candidate division WOR-3 bacterium]